MESEFPNEKNELRFTTVLAVKSESESFPDILISRGPSCLYENPRNGSSS